MGGLEVKNCGYTYSSFKGNYCTESKITEYGIILLHKHKVEQAEVISRLLFTFLLTNYRTFGQMENLHFSNTNFHASFTVTTS